MKYTTHILVLVHNLEIVTINCLIFHFKKVTKIALLDTFNFQFQYTFNFQYSSFVLENLGLYQQSGHLL